jgi:hypothetical protein
MNPASKSRTGGREPDAGTGEVDTKNKKTPPSDMQAEDAGTAASGNEGTAAEGAMKQEHKTEGERGSKR